MTSANDLEEWLENLSIQDSSRGEIRRKFQEVSQQFENYIMCCEELSAHLTEWGEVDRVAGLNAEAEMTEERFKDLEVEVNARLADLSASRLSMHTPKAVPAKTNSQQISVREEIQRLTLELEQTFAAVKREFEEIEQISQDQTPVEKTSLPPAGVDSLARKQPYQELTQQRDVRPKQPNMYPTVTAAAPDARMLLSSTPYRQELLSIQPARLKFAMRPTAPAFQPQQIPELSTIDSVSFDSSRLLERVHVPKFDGDKRNYEGWKAAFLSCVDRTNCTAEYKLLRLHNSLQGDALKIIENLGYSATAYAVAMNRLERKYGGRRRQITLRLEELDKFSPIRPNS